MHHVFDPDDGDALAAKGAHQVHQFTGLGIGQPAADLVEQQHLGAGGQRPHQLQPLAAQQAQSFCTAVGQRLHATQAQALHGAVARIAGVQACAVRGAGEHVFKHRHAQERTGHLVGARNTCTAAVCRTAGAHIHPLEPDGALAWRKRSGQHVQQRGLARTVGPDDAHGLVTAHRKIELIQHFERTKSHVDALRLQ